MASHAAMETRATTAEHKAETAGIGLAESAAREVELRRELEEARRGLEEREGGYRRRHEAAEAAAAKQTAELARDNTHLRERLVAALQSVEEMRAAHEARVNEVERKVKEIVARKDAVIERLRGEVEETHRELQQVQELVAS